MNTNEEKNTSKSKQNEYGEEKKRKMGTLIELTLIYKCNFSCN